MSDTTTAPEAAPANDATQQPSPSLGVADIAAAVRVIEYAYEQGAFKTMEVAEQVVAVRRRLSDFVAAAQAIQQQAAEAEAATAATEAADETSGA